MEEREPALDGSRALLDDAGAKPERLAPDRLRRLGALYRAAAADLAFARRRLPARRGDAAARAAGHRRAAGGLRRRGAAALAALVPLTRLLAAACASGRGRWPPRSCCCSARWCWRRCGRSTTRRRRSASCRRSSRARRSPAAGPAALSGSDQAALASQIFTNNIRVTFLAIAGGIFGGLGTAAVTIFNGGFIGAILGLTIENGQSGELLRLILPHGVLELSCIAIGATAGLRIGWALVDPGTLTRGESLRREARPAMELVLGTMPWLVLAGLVEGFVTGDLGLAGAIVVGVRARRRVLGAW